MTGTAEKLQYKNKIILAPMVRVGTLPMRLLAIQYGADIVYSEELIDWKFLRSFRRVNDVLNTVDFIDKSDGTIIFRTCDLEKKKVVVQLGTCDPDRALQVAKIIENDVAGIDINMGCPKEFSIKGGMGSALLTQPEKATSILRTLVQNLSIPVSCKIRVFENVQETIELVKKLVSTGISAIAIHGRTKNERPRHTNRNETIKYVSQHIDIPVIANGGSRDIDIFKDISIFRDSCGVSSVMIARTAQGNCSIFSSTGLEDIEDVISKYLKLCVDYDNAPGNTKYCVQNMLKELQETPKGKKFLDCQTLQQICELWQLGDYCKQKELEYQKKGNFGRREITPDLLQVKRKCIREEEDVHKLPLAFIRSSYIKHTDLPKSQLLSWCVKNNCKPSYKLIHSDKLFRSVLTVNEKKYSSSFWEKNKRFSEQGAALVFLNINGIVNRNKLVEDGSLLC